MWSRDNDVLSLNDRREKERKMYIYYILYIYIYLQTNCCDVQRRVSTRLCASACCLFVECRGKERKGRKGKGDKTARRLKSW